MATQEQEDAVRRIKRTCRGPHVFSETDRAWIAALIEEAHGMSPGMDVYQYRWWRHKMLRWIKVLNEMSARPLSDMTFGNLQTHSDFIAAGCFAYQMGGEDIGKPCNYDFNEVILSNPLDGLERPYTCPRCGREGTYVAPFWIKTTFHFQDDGTAPEDVDLTGTTDVESPASHQWIVDGEPVDQPLSGFTASFGESGEHTVILQVDNGERVAEERKVITLS